MVACVNPSVVFPNSEFRHCIGYFGRRENIVNMALLD